MSLSSAICRSIVMEPDVRTRITVLDYHKLLVLSSSSTSSSQKSFSSIPGGTHSQLAFAGRSESSHVATTSSLVQSLCPATTADAAEPPSYAVTGSHGHVGNGGSGRHPMEKDWNNSRCDRTLKEADEGLARRGLVAECFRSRNGALEVSSAEVIDVDTDSLKSVKTMANERNQLVTEVMTSLGPGRPGLLAVRGVPTVDVLRRRLLPLAKKLALMPDDVRRSVLKDHGLCTDVSMKRSDRSVSAFAMQLQYACHSHAEDGSCILPQFSKSSPGCLCNVLNFKHQLNSMENLAKGESDLDQLGSIFQQLGACMVEVGLLVARLCDSAICSAGLEDAIWESGSVKTRLIHYHSYAEKDHLSSLANLDNRIKMKRASSSKFSSSARPFEDRTEPSFGTVPKGANPSICCTAHDSMKGNSEELWQQWHYDYGILTVLTAPMFLASEGPECEIVSGGHTGLRILSTGMDDFVSIPTDCLLVQVGEAAQIASGGKLAATAHCVCRPSSSQIDMSRETFVTFLQPAWHRVLCPPRGATREEVLKACLQGICTVEHHKQVAKPHYMSLREAQLGECAKLFSVVPSLDLRWKENCTFAEFSRETTGQYYGAHGHQSHKTGQRTG